MTLEHYPELHRVPLGRFVRRLLRELGYEPDRLDDPKIALGQRYSQICTASVRRLFMFGLWNQGVSYGHGKTDSPRAMVDAIAAFVFDRKSVDAMSSLFPFVELADAARAHEQEKLVEHRWAEYLAWTTTNVIKRALLPIIQETSQRPRLRTLFPFVSLHSLQFSRTTGYPYRAIDAFAAPIIHRDWSLAEAIEHGRYEVLVTGQHGPRSLGIGDVVWAADLLETAVPSYVGPAVNGTADDMP
jgi:hypothetical protein